MEKSMPSSMPPVEIITNVTPLPPRPKESNKGDFGKVLVVAGSRGMSGAAVLCASAALRGGAGLVRLAVPEGILPIVAAATPCYMTAPMRQDEQGKLATEAVPDLLALMKENDVLAIGPGLGRGAGIPQVVGQLLTYAEIPVVLDADGLNAIVGQIYRITNRKATSILTPHPGEFARLLGADIATVQANRQELAQRFAFEHRLILVLKGHGTLVTDGHRLYVNSTGNPGMATGGTGDVLTGLIAALVGQGLEAFAAAQLGVYLHGLAGDLACEALGEMSLLASDLLVYLPAAIVQTSKSRPSN
jgi:ADP-dependent NAD(P)H-hydrate dehydratase